MKHGRTIKYTEININRLVRKEYCEFYHFTAVDSFTFCAVTNFHGLTKSSILRMFDLWFFKSLHTSLDTFFTSLNI